MSRWARLRCIAWESLVIASFVTAAFFAFFDPRLHGSEEPVPGWLADRAATYGLGLVIFWFLTALTMEANRLLALPSSGHGV